MKTDPLEEMRRDTLSPLLRDEFRRSTQAVEAWVQCAPRPSLEAALAWSEQIRVLFGDPPVERRPWQEKDLRL